MQRGTVLRLGGAVVLFLALFVLGSSGASWVKVAEASHPLPSWCPTVPTVPTIPGPPTVPTFPDVPPTHWAFEYIETLAYYGYVSGFPDGNYYPSLAVNRAQLATFFVRADKGTSFTPPTPTVPPFPDVPLSFWAVSWIAQAKADGFVTGFPDGNYYPLNAVTRAQAAVLTTRLVHGAGFTPPTPTAPPFPDVPVTHWAASWIAQGVADELFAGFPDGNFYPQNSLTRAQIAVLLANALCLPGFP